MADASLPDIRARSRPGTAMAAMMPMMATTINNSIRVKPFSFRILMCVGSLESVQNPTVGYDGRGNPYWSNGGAKLGWILALW